MSNLVVEVLVRLIKPAVAALLGAAIFGLAVALGEPASLVLALLAWLAAAALVLLVQESPL
jgi:hypothetical protein